MEESARRARLEALFSAHAGAVRAYARRRIGAGAADDTVSEVFVVAWRRLEDVADDALPWLLGCARRDVALQKRLSVSTAGVRIEDRILALALASLSDRDREVLLLVAWEGLEPAKAARVLGCSRNALAVRLHRARRRLAAALDQSGEPGHIDRELSGPAREAV